MPHPAPDEDLHARQAALQAEATGLLAALDLAATVADLGPLLPTGSYVSGLMCWRDLDVMVHVGPDFTPHDVLRLLGRIVDRPGVTGFAYHDERGPRSPTGTARDERYHLPVAVSHAGEEWRVDLTLWLNDAHANLTAWHEHLRDTITAGQRAAVLRIKDVWHRRPGYPDRVGGVDIYAAVVEHGVRTPEQFGAWLAARDRPTA
jgi:hypothetical protein